MPSVSRKQQRFMFAEEAKKKKGLPTKTNMTYKQLHEFEHLKASPKKGRHSKKKGA